MEVLMFTLYVLITTMIVVLGVIVVGTAFIDYWFKKKDEERTDAFKKLAEASKTVQNVLDWANSRESKNVK
jgi:hypothetical protein